MIAEGFPCYNCPLNNKCELAKALNGLAFMPLYDTLFDQLEQTNVETGDLIATFIPEIYFHQNGNIYASCSQYRLGLGNKATTRNFRWAK